MKKNKTLVKLSKNKLDINKTYQSLYKEKKPRKAKLVKFKIKIPESKGMTTFFKLLFLFPVPVGLLNFFMKNSSQKISKDIDIEIRDILKLGLYKGMYIKVNAEDGTKIILKTI